MISEHRVIDGCVTDAEHVHHLNYERADNRPNNLLGLTAEDHSEMHAINGWRVDAARLYRNGLSTVKVGKLVRRHPATVYRALVAMGVPIRSRLNVAAKS